MSITPSASYAVTVRLSITNRPGMLGKVASVIGVAGGDIGAVDLVETSRARVLRDITINARDDLHGTQLVNRLKKLPGVRVINVSDRTFLMHLGGKIEVRNKVPIRTRDDLSMAYTPGVARVCLAIRDDRRRAFALTIKQNTVAVVTDGTAVLGLGDIGPEAANQINNVLCFPGFFRGLLDSRARSVHDEMKLAAARAIAAYVSASELGAEYIIPSVFNKAVAPAVAEGVARAAFETGLARRGTVGRGGPRHGPPHPPTLGTTPAKPGSSSTPRPTPGTVPAKPGSSSTPRPTPGTVPAKPGSSSTPRPARGNAAAKSSSTPRGRGRRAPR